MHLFFLTVEPVLSSITVSRIMLLQSGQSFADAMHGFVCWPVCVCVSTPVSKDTTLVFLIYPTSFSVQKQGDNPMDAVGCPTKRAAFHG